MLCLAQWTKGKNVVSQFVVNAPVFAIFNFSISASLDSPNYFQQIRFVIFFREIIKLI